MSAGSTIRLCSISGSLGAGSTNNALLRAFARHAPDDVAVDLGASIGSLPLFDPDLEANTPQTVLNFAADIEACDGLIIASPEYAHGMTGVLKNALDWLVSRAEIPHKPVMLVHASTRSDTSRAHLREVLRTMSCLLSDDKEFAIHLIGKSPADIEALLGTEAVRAQMRETLQRFSSSIREKS